MKLTEDSLTDSSIDEEIEEDENVQDKIEEACKSTIPSEILARPKSKIQPIRIEANSIQQYLSSIFEEETSEEVTRPTPEAPIASSVTHQENQMEQEMSEFLKGIEPLGEEVIIEANICDGGNINLPILEDFESEENTLKDAFKNFNPETETFHLTMEDLHAKIDHLTKIAAENLLIQQDTNKVVRGLQALLLSGHPLEADGGIVGEKLPCNTIEGVQELNKKLGDDSFRSNVVSISLITYVNCFVNAYFLLFF